ncbi:hypothetical protein [Saccharomonospora marina]|uniref:hypothetical protein n=1 Tax=Saccharomonospora marina TaxID=632569 RepID=UPI0012F91BFD|nr:hypothetical protein [Saccharomonospora marina]
MPPPSRTCDAVGQAQTPAIAYATGNSDPALGLYRDLGELVGSVSWHPRHVDSRLLRHVMDHTHPPAEGSC